MQRINITLPDDLAKDFRRSIPTRSRSKFIADMIKEKLPTRKHLRRDLIKSLKANRKFYEQVAEEWKATEVEGWPE